ncbi:hypothetical protein [Terricaulis sp.]|uniref:hypothetical protein n=1 Tax=Terricaulis sp. TaxID=2768686 RepID=UPI002AC71F76|nr:hypothetical protein [Terricaulis sp.]MDZ4691298.1 hypothetical protein [Terricaulis sp.]
MTKFIHTMEGYAINTAHVVRARREKTEDGLWVWRIDTTAHGSYRVADNGATPFTYLNQPAGK